MIAHARRETRRDLLVPEPAKTVRPTGHRYSAATVSAFAGVVGVTLLLVLYLAQCASLVATQCQLSRLQHAKAALERDGAELSLRLEGLSALDRIESLARDRYGMTAPATRLVLDMTHQPPAPAAVPSGALAMGRTHP